ncbi:hypothetical protein [Nocardia cerradoensis]|uniref:Uncharacterized protein n=1 Tax=Nocardia cerradoensis TaxID=85688 RepID=A0A231GTD7_9NOCA|nr:hypothetical protein [Nocardia cerradoensis]NKY47969.1 hypothetical protein [Nocardia cerradoensis]OXR39815.1 hypothetical protein B7C42_08103 [Nocardia cerradoensis]
MSNPLANIETPVLVARTAVLTEVEKTFKAHRTAHRAELAARMGPGSKITAFDPADDTLTLGTASMSNPDPVAYITDKDAFEAWCRVTFPDPLETWTEIDATDAEVIEVLRKHAPHLVIVHNSIKSTVIERGLDRAAKQDVPGTKRTKGKSTLTVTPAEHARAVVQAMVAQSPVLRELEA